MNNPPPLKALFNALLDLGQAIESDKHARQRLEETRTRLALALEAVEEAYGPAFDAAVDLGKALPSTFVIGEHSVSLYEESGKSVLRDIQHVYELERLAEQVEAREQRA